MGFFLGLHSLTDWALLVLRIDLAATFFIHGILKWKMWNMQPNQQLSPTMLNIFRILSVAEPLGAVALLFGFLTQLAALGIATIMVGASIMKSRKMHKKFHETGGWELDTALLAGALILLAIGAGAISLDRLVFGL